MSISEKENLGAFYLEELFQEIAHSDHPDTMGYARRLSAEIEAYKNKAVDQEMMQWQHYANNLKAWARRHGLNTKTMEAGMTEPNPPHYNIANND